MRNVKPVLDEIDAFEGPLVPLRRPRRLIRDGLIGIGIVSASGLLAAAMVNPLETGRRVEAASQPTASSFPRIADAQPAPRFAAESAFEWALTAPPIPPRLARADPGRPVMTAEWTPAAAPPPPRETQAYADNTPARPGRVEDSVEAAPSPPRRAVVLAEITPPRPAPADETAQDAPLPPANPYRPLAQATEEAGPRPHPRPSSPRAVNSRVAAAPQPPEDNRNFLQKLFDPPKQPAGPALAYARPDDGGIANTPAFSNAISPPVTSGTAVYDISAHTVYLPNGTQLEAHSGLGGMIDNPAGVHIKMRGATPPHVYNLTLREAPFHGVRALRLTPADGASVFGRVGLLAHTYMLGPRGDSNGCVSFKNYAEFLRAFERGDVKRLLVVARR